MTEEKTGNEKADFEYQPFITVMISREGQAVLVIGEEGDREVIPLTQEMWAEVQRVFHPSRAGSTELMDKVSELIGKTLELKEIIEFHDAMRGWRTDA